MVVISLRLSSSLLYLLQLHTAQMSTDKEKVELSVTCTATATAVLDQIMALHEDYESSADIPSPYSRCKEASHLWKCSGYICWKLYENVLTSCTRMSQVFSP